MQVITGPNFGKQCSLRPMLPSFQDGYLFSKTSVKGVPSGCGYALGRLRGEQLLSERNLTKTGAILFKSNSLGLVPGELQFSCG